MREDASSEDHSSEDYAAGGAPDGWMDARVEAYVDDALPPGERAAFEERLRDAPRWRRAVRRARRLGRTLRALPQPPCPPEVTQAVFEQTTRPAGASPAGGSLPSTLHPDRRAAPRGATRPAPGPARPAAWQPVLAMALLLAVAAAAAMVGRPSTPPPAAYSQAEVRRAAAEAEWALALVAEVTHKAGRAVHEDVLQERVATRVAVPVRRALALPALDDVLAPAPPDSLR